MTFLTANQAADLLGLSPQRVRRMCADGKIQSQKVGRDWIINESELKNVTVYGKAGRPKGEGK